MYANRDWLKIVTSALEKNINSLSDYPVELRVAVIQEILTKNRNTNKPSIITMELAKKHLPSPAIDKTTHPLFLHSDAYVSSWIGIACSIDMKHGSPFQLLEKFSNSPQLNRIIGTNGYGEHILRSLSNRTGSLKNTIRFAPKIFSMFVLSFINHDYWSYESREALDILATRLEGLKYSISTPLTEEEWKNIANKIYDGANASSLKILKMGGQTIPKSIALAAIYSSNWNAIEFILQRENFNLESLTDSHGNNPWHFFVSSNLETLTSDENKSKINIPEQTMSASSRFNILSSYINKYAEGFLTPNKKGETPLDLCDDKFFKDLKRMKVLTTLEFSTLIKNSGISKNKKILTSIIKKCQTEKREVVERHLLNLTMAIPESSSKNALAL